MLKHNQLGLEIVAHVYTTVQTDVFMVQLHTELYNCAFFFPVELNSSATATEGLIGNQMV